MLELGRMYLLSLDSETMDTVATRVYRTLATFLFRREAGSGSRCVHPDGS